MALTIDDTLQGTYSNSYVSVEFADEYWANHFSTTKSSQWSGLSEEQKTTALINACRIIEGVRCTVDARSWESYDTYYDRRSGRVVQLDRETTPIKSLFHQKLQFPRNLDRDPDDGEFYIPEDIKMAQCEQALFLLNYDETAIANTLQGVEADSITAGNIRIRQSFKGSGTALAPMAYEYLRPYFIRGSSSMRRA